MRGLFRPYVDILGPDRGWRFFLAGFVARLLRSTGGIGAIMLVSGSGAGFAAAGTASGAFVVGSAIGGPLWSAAIDRAGQRRVLPFALVALALTSSALLAAVVAGLPVWTWIVCTLLVGISAVDVSALVRARWLRLLREPPRRHTALSLEAVADEAAFVAGPPIVTLVAGVWSPVAGFAIGVATTLLGGIALLLLDRSAAPFERRVGDAPRRIPARLLGILPAYFGLGLMFGSVDLTSVGIGYAIGLPWLAGVLLAVFAVGSTVSGLLWGPLAGRWTLRRRMLTAGVGFAIVIPLFAVVRDPVSYALLSLAGGLVMTPVAVSSATFIEYVADPRSITVAMSWPNIAISVGVTIGASLGGIATDHGSPYGALVLTPLSGLVVLATLGANVLRMPPRRVVLS